MDDKNLPKEVSRGSVELMPGLTIEVVHLDNGMRLITDKSLEDFLNFLESFHTIEGNAK